jgi:RNA polymerase sigma factor (sigma-70 family)
MYAICLRYSSNSDEAKDLLQDGFIKLFKKIKSYRGDADFIAWVKRLFINHCIDYLRSAYKKKLFYVDSVYHEEIEEELQDNELKTRITKEQVFAALNLIRPDYRLILNMYAIEGLSHIEISEKLGIQESSSRSKLSRARVALKKQLGVE